MVADIDSTIDISKIKLVSQTGGKVEDSKVFRGLMIPKKRISSDMHKEVNRGKIILIDGGLEKSNVATDLKLNVTTVGVLESFRQEERNMLKRQVDNLVEHGVTVLELVARVSMMKSKIIWQKMVFKPSEGLRVAT